MKVRPVHILVIGALALLLGIGTWIANYAWEKNHSPSDLYERIMMALAEEDPERISIYKPAFRRHISRYKSRLTPIVSSALERRKQLLGTLYAELDQIEADQLTAAEKQEYAIVKEQLAFRQLLLTHDELNFPVSTVDGVQVALPELFAIHHEILSEEDCKSFLARVKIVDDKVLSVARMLKARAEKGIIPPQFLVSQVIAQTDAFLAVPPDQNPVYLGFARKIIRLDPPEMNELEASDYIGLAANLLESEIYPAFEAFRKTLAELPPNTQGPGLWQYAEGSNYYAGLLQHYVGTERLPGEWHQWGLKQLDSLENLKPDVAVDEDYFCEGEEENFCLKTYEQLFGETLPLTAGLFDTLPARNSLRVIATVIPGIERAENAVYFPAAIDGSQPGFLGIQTGKPELHTQASLPSTIYRLGIPGGHLLNVGVNANPGIPEYRKYWDFPAFTRGWALYGDYLMANDLQLYSGNPVGRSGYLLSQRKAVAGLIADTGIHHEKWTTEQALQFLVERGGYKTGEAGAKLAEILSKPGYQAAAWIGFVNLLKIRRDFEQRRGDNFYLPEFHRLLLNSGPGPINLKKEEAGLDFYKKLAG